MSGSGRRARTPRVCPWWLGYLLVSPLRRLSQHPDRLLAPHVRPGMTVLDFGSGMGYFSLPIARIVGPSGRVVCVDLQERMLHGLRRRAGRAGLGERLDVRPASAEDRGLGDLAGQVDFALVFAVVHEVPDAERLLDELRDALKPGGRLLIAEPRGHVSEEAWTETIAKAEKAGFEVVERPAIWRSRAALLARAAP